MKLQENCLIPILIYAISIVRWKIICSLASIEAEIFFILDASAIKTDCSFSPFMGQEKFSVIIHVCGCTSQCSRMQCPMKPPAFLNHFDRNSGGGTWCKVRQNLYQDYGQKEKSTRIVFCGLQHQSFKFYHPDCFRTRNKIIQSP